MQNPASQLVNQGLAALNADEYTKAINLFDTALRHDSRNVAALRGKGAALRFLNKDSEALTWFEKVLVIDSRDIWTIHQKAQILHFDKPDAAIACYDQILFIDPKNTDALAMKGAALESNSKFKEALACYNSILSFDPKNTNALSRKGTLACQTEQWAEAISCFKLLRDSDPKDTFALNMLVAYVKTNRLKEGENLLEELIAYHPNDLHIHINRANYYLQNLADYDKVILMIDKALTLIEQHPEKISVNNVLYDMKYKRKTELLILKYHAYLNLNNLKAAKTCLKEISTIIKSKLIPEVIVYDTAYQYIIKKFNFYLIQKSYKRAEQFLTTISKQDWYQKCDAERRERYDKHLNTLKFINLILMDKDNAKQYENIINQSSNNTTKEVLLINGLIFLINKKTTNAKTEFDHYEKLAKCLNDKLEDLYIEGTACLELGFYNEAELAYSKALNLKANYLPALNGLKQIPTRDQLRKKELEENKKREEELIKIKKQEQKNKLSQFDEELNLIEESLKSLTLQTRSDVNAQFVKFEQQAQEHKSVRYYHLRADFFYDSANMESSSIRKDILYKKALADYNLALNEDPFISDTVTQRIDEIRKKLNVSQAELVQAQHKIPEKPQITIANANVTTVNRNVLNDVQVRKLEEIKERLRKERERSQLQKKPTT